MSIAALAAPIRQPSGVVVRPPARARYGDTVSPLVLAEVGVQDAVVNQAAPLDAALIDRLRGGDAEAFADIVAKYSPAMLHVARGFVSTSASAEDVVQEAWLAVIKGLDGFEGRASLRTWACRITANIARRRGVLDARTVPWTDAFGDNSADDGPTVDAEIRTVLADALSCLPDRHRTVVALRDVDGLTAEEVCEALGLSMGNQRVLLHRGRAQLRQLLENYYVGKADTQ
jgi:RNA polymerase sigma-70 factor (ECF subfamily)